MSSAGVNALLAFIYCSSVDEAVKSSAIALELLIAADKYDIPLLWKACVIILLDKDVSRFDIDVALTLFGFASKKKMQEDGERLMVKATMVLSRYVSKTI